MYIFTCSNDFESMMTCIYDVWDARLGSQNVRLALEPVGQQELFSTYIHVDMDTEKAAKVIRSISRKISWEAYRQIYLAAMTEEEDRLDVIYRFLRVGFACGAGVTRMLAEPSVMRLFELSRRCGNEMHSYREFIRFSRIEPGIYVSHIEPTCNVAALTAKHFEDRMPSEHWLIIDDRRKLAVVHPKNQPIYLTTLTEEELMRLAETEAQSDPYTDLWEEFFRTIGIKERENPRCQRNLFPIHYRKHATEFIKRA